MRRYAFIVMGVAALALAPAVHADAQEDRGVRRVGIRVGGTADPKQFHVGLHVNAGAVSERIRFHPSIEIGFGDDRTVLVGNFDALYLLGRSRSVQPFVGAGLGVGAVWYDSGPGSVFEGRELSTDALLGANLLAGLWFGTRPVAGVTTSIGSGVRWVLELRGGLGDIPAFKATIGVNL